MLVIRLSRVGKKKHPTYRVIVSEKTKDTVGDYLEQLGHYDPHVNKAVFKAERIQYWISKGAQPSGVVHNLLIDNKVIEGEKVKVANIKKKKEEKSDEENATPKAPEAEKKVEEKAAEKPKSEEKPVAEEKPSLEEKEEDKPEEQKQ